MPPDDFPRIEQPGWPPKLEVKTMLSATPNLEPGILAIAFGANSGMRGPALRYGHASESEYHQKIWPQNGRKTSTFWAQILRWQVSKGRRRNVDFAEFWGGRWDLNPRLSVPQTDALPAELLPPLVVSLA